MNHETKMRCDYGCSVAKPCPDCPCVPFDPIVGHSCDLPAELAQKAQPLVPLNAPTTYYSASYVARKLAGIAKQADTLRTLGVRIPTKSDYFALRLPNGQQFRASIQEVRSTDPDYRARMVSSDAPGSTPLAGIPLSHRHLAVTGHDEEPGCCDVE